MYFLEANGHLLPGAGAWVFIQILTRIISVCTDASNVESLVIITVNMLHLVFICDIIKMQVPSSVETDIEGTLNSYGINNKLIDNCYFSHWSRF